LIHTDICGPITTDSFSEKEYFITLIDDFSRKCWVYFLKEKFETFVIFKKYKVMVEKPMKLCLSTKIRQRRRVLVKRIQDILQEAESSEILDSTLYTTAKWSCRKKNWTILDMVRPMINMKILAETMRCVVYIQIRCPHMILENKTPQ
jgi:hypothetical protein